MKINDIVNTVSKREGANFETRLQVGDIVRYDGSEQVVWMVNDCRASLLRISATGKAVSFTDPGTGQAHTFNARDTETHNISPDSPLEIIRRLGKAGLIALLTENKQQTKTMSKNTEDNDEKESKPKLGRLGGFLGFPVTAAIRKMAKAGWEFWEIKKVLTDEGVAVADNTIRIQLSAGRAGTGGEPAEISKKKLAELRPDASEKPERGGAKPEKKGKSKPAAAKSKKAKDEDDEDEDEDDDEKPAPKPAKKVKKPADDDEDSDEDDDSEEDAKPAAKEKDADEDGEEADPEG